MRLLRNPRPNPISRYEGLLIPSPNAPDLESVKKPKNDHVRENESDQGPEANGYHVHAAKGVHDPEANADHAPEANVDLDPEVQDEDPRIENDPDRVIVKDPDPEKGKVGADLNLEIGRDMVEKGRRTGKGHAPEIVNKVAGGADNLRLVHHHLINYFRPVFKIM